MTTVTPKTKVYYDIADQGLTSSAKRPTNQSGLDTLTKIEKYILKISTNNAENNTSLGSLKLAANKIHEGLENRKIEEFKKIDEAWKSYPGFSSIIKAFKSFAIDNILRKQQPIVKRIETEIVKLQQEKDKRLSALNTLDLADALKIPYREEEAHIKTMWQLSQRIELLKTAVKRLTPPLEVIYPKESALSVLDRLKDTSTQDLNALSAKLTAFSKQEGAPELPQAISTLQNHIKHLISLHNKQQEASKETST